MDARRLALKILKIVDESGGYSQLLLAANLDAVELEERDRALVTELVNGIIRREKTLDFLIGRFLSRPLLELDRPLLRLLRLGAYQLLFLDKIPDHAAVNSTVDLAKKNAPPGAEKLVNAVLRRIIRQRQSLPWPNRRKELPLFLAVYHSHPQWLVDLWLNDLGAESAEALLAADNRRPPLTLRVNALKTTLPAVENYLKERGATVTRGRLFPNETLVVGDSGLPKELFEKGLVYAQDEASVAVGRAVDPHPGETVIDLCAAPGGKATYLAQLMENRGRVLAVDINETRLNLLRENSRLLNAKIVEAHLGDGAKKLDLPEADRLLVDAPCSGLGVLARRPDLRWRKSPELVLDLARLQKKILNQAAGYLRPGGLLVYSVCTITKPETVGVVSDFCRRHKEFKVLSTKQFLPHIDGVDGMFVARLGRRPLEKLE